jgi:molybdopterin molybdotransferase
MISLEAARTLIAEHVQPGPARAVELSAALGQVLAESVAADQDYPAHDRAMMDGYALAADDPAGRFRVVGEAKPGAACEVVPGAGECVRIFTGAALPARASQVIMQEDTRCEGEWMIPLRRGAERYVRPRGTEARAGDVVLPAGGLLGAAELAILTQVGQVCPRVIIRPEVTHLATGDELIDPAAAADGGQIRDTNSTLIRALVERHGGVVTAHARLGDRLEDIVKFAGAHPAPLLLISGGASVGEYDFGTEALRRLGYTIHFDRVNLRPGKPLTFATREGRAAFVMPGNPVSHFACFHGAVRLALERLGGRVPQWSFLNLPLLGGAPLRRNARETLWPARVVAREGALVATPLAWSSSGDTFSLAGANGLIRIAADTDPGETMPVLPLDLPGVK